MKIERYLGHVIGWTIRGKKYLIDNLTARAIRKSKEKE